MAERLKSISKRISWSSVIKAVVFGVAWWALPFWLFLLVALYLSLVPVTGARKVLAPFLVLLLLCLATAQGILAAILFAAIFYFMLLIKDLIIIDRRTAYEVLILVLSYLVVRELYVTTGGALGGKALLYSLIAAGAVSVMAAGFIKHFSAVPDGAAREAHSFRRMLGGLSFILMWQLLIVGLFLPLDFLYQSAVVFLAAAVLIDVVPQYVFGELSRTKALATGTVLFSLLVIVLASAHWTL
ncbi:MAG TPA: hypothetical protein VMA75_04725 [Candidatus Paceibacterota bacterium]|nr:hypothetical protein [Candidatus Paceibacterota bacterium]